MARYFLKGTKQKRPEIDGYKFGSVNELNYYHDFLKFDPEIKIVSIQPLFELQEKFEINGKKIADVNYTADFDLEVNGGRWIVEIKNALNIKDAAYNIRKRLFLKRYGPTLRFREVVYSGRKVKETIDY